MFYFKYLKATKITIISYSKKNSMFAPNLMQNTVIFGTNLVQNKAIFGTNLVQKLLKLDPKK